MKRRTAWKWILTTAVAYVSLALSGSCAPIASTVNDIVSVAETAQRTIALVKPYPPVPGKQCIIYYNAGGRPLADAHSIWLHYGGNAWSVVMPDVLMTGTVGGIWSCTVYVSSKWDKIDCAFFDGNNLWDNNDQDDWHFKMEPVTSITATALSQLHNADNDDIGTNRVVDIFASRWHTMAVGAVDFSPDGRLLASADWYGHIKIWDVASHRMTKELYLANANITHVVFVPDGRHLLVGYIIITNGCFMGTVKLIDLETSRDEFTIEVDRNNGLFSLSADGKLLAINQRTNVVIWNLSTRLQIRTLVGHKDEINAITFSPDGTRIATCSGISCVDRSDHRSSDGRFIPVGDALTCDRHRGLSDNTIRLWDARSGASLMVITGHTEAVTSIAFVGTGTWLVSSGRDGTMKLWDVSSGREQHSDCVDRVYETRLAMIPNSLRVAIGNGETACIVEFPKGNRVRQLSILPSMHSVRSVMVESFAVSSNGYCIAAGHNDGSITIWDSRTGATLAALGKQLKGTSSVGYAPNGKMIANGGEDGFVRLWDPHTGNQLSVMDDSPCITRDVKFSPDSTMLLCAGDYVNLWDIRTNMLVRTFRGLGPALVRSVCFFSNGTHMVSSSPDATINVWDVTSGGLLHTWDVKDESMILKSFPDDARILSGATGKCRIFDSCTGRQLKEFGSNTGWSMFSADISTDGRYIITAGREVCLWEGDSGKLVKKLCDDSRSTAFGPDGETAMSGHADGRVKIWDIKSRRMIAELQTGLVTVNSLSYAPDSACVLLGCDDGTMQLWDLKTRTKRATFVGYTDGEWITITPDGYYVSSANGDKYLNVRIGNRVYGVDNFRMKFNRPDLLQLALKGESLVGRFDIRKINEAPIVRLGTLPPVVSNDMVTLSVALENVGGGVGDVRVYLNGSAVIQEKARAAGSATNKAAGMTTRKYSVRLVNGTNTIKVIAFNSDGTMNSAEAVQEIGAVFEDVQRPSLHAVIVGINEYNNPHLSLYGAVPDAQLFAESLGKGAGALFKHVNITILTNGADTTKERIENQLKSMRTLQPDDLFVFYAAAHGTVVDGDYYLFTSDVGSTSSSNLKKNALDQDTLKDLLANIPTTKKLILLDSCNAQALGTELLIAMATRTRSADDSVAIRKLSTAVGSTILSAATATQAATEGYNGHGIFTYVVSEGLGGKADTDRDGYVKTSELESYIDDEVPRIAAGLTNNDQKAIIQYPTCEKTGMAFPIAKVK